MHNDGMQPSSSRPLRASRWHQPAVRGVVYQVLAVGAVGLLAWFLISNTLANLHSRNIASGFGFLQGEAGFAIGESVIAYSPQDSVARAILVGLLNTLKIAAVGIVLSTALGTLVGIARLSKNVLVAKLAAAYVELVRNVPLLLQLFFWYALVTEHLPGPRQALNPLPGVFLSNRGMKVPVPVDHIALDLALGGLFLAIVLWLLVANIARRRQAATGQRLPVLRIGIALVVALPVLGWLVGGAPIALDVPRLQGFNFTGGATLSPEFAALLAGLVFYTTAFTAEVVRAGIQSVNTGQWEAAGSIGLSRGLALRLVVLPQALRVIVPPMTSQFLNLTKNSSLAIAIGYPDLVSVVNTSMSQTGQAIESILIIMGAYLVVSLTISVAMNLYNRRIALTER
jgi:general L-amino acid transport system permease protein